MTFAGESHSTTTSQLITFNHRWIVDNFSFLFWTSLESAQFSPSINPNLKFSLKLFPVRDDEIFYNSEAITDDEIGVYLHMHSKCSPVLRVKFWLSTMSGYKPLKHCYSEKMIHSVQGKVGSFLRSYLKEYEFSLLPNDKLTICCEISYINDSIANSLQASANVQMLCEKAQKLSLESYRSLMESGKHSDVVICVDDEGKTKEFPLHKMILSEKSSVFEAMFKHEMKEAKQNRVLITDVNVNVFELLIRYIYYGNIEQLDKYAMELMEVADKYDIAQLKQLCQQYLGANMCLDNVIDLLVYADMHNANELKDSAIDFIKKNYISVVKSDKWKSLFKKQPKLFAELMDLNLNLGD